MMLDAGHVANVQGGIVSSALGIKEKSIKLKMGEWKVLNTSAPICVSPSCRSLIPAQSETLFKLLGLLVEMGKEVASIKDVLSGETKTNMQPTTVLALIDQGMQFFTAIYKRIHRTLKAELQIHQRLNAEHLDPQTYSDFFDDQQQYDPKADFAADMGISPISDPTVSSKMQALARAEFIEGIWKNHPTIISEAEVVQRMLQAGAIEDGAKLITPPQPPDPLMQMLGELEAQDKMAGITEKLTAAIKNIADAEAAEDGQQLAYYQQVMDALGMEHGMEMDHANAAGQGQPGPMAGAPDNAMGALPAPPAGAGAGGPAEGTAVPPGGPPGQPGADMGVPAA
jgi:chaperonin GroES